MTRLGIFGGSFDPPHLAHLRVARTACDHLKLNRLLWIPAGVPPHKMDLTISDKAQRVQMTELMVKEDPRFELDLRETKVDSPSYSVATIQSLRDEFPEAHLFMIVGEDQLRDFAKWKQPEKIVELADLVCYKRTGSSEERPIASVSEAASLTWLPGEPVNLSSTEIRDAVRKGASIQDLVPDTIGEYIKSSGLYLSA